MARPKKYSTPEEAYRAKLASNARREAQRIMRIEIKPEKAEGEAIKAAAKEVGESTQVYILEAVRNRMDAEKAGATVCKIRNDAVGPAAEAAGQSIKEYVTQAIQERMEREQ